MTNKSKTVLKLRLLKEKLRITQDALNNEKYAILSELSASCGLEDDEEPDWKNMYSDERWCNYFGASEPIEYKYDIKLNLAHAKFAADVLIASHIAHKNRPLHGDVALKKLEKHGEIGQDVAKQIQDSVFKSQIAGVGPYLHAVLYRKYNVLLLDTNYARHLYASKREAQNAIPFQYSLGNIDGVSGLEKNIAKYEKQLKLFHKSVLEAAKQQICVPEKPF